MLRKIAIVLAALALAVPARAATTDQRVVHIYALPVVMPAGGASTWVVALQGPWADVTVDLTIPALLADPTFAPLSPYMKCSDSHDDGEGPEATYTLRCHVIDSPTSITVRGRVLVAPEPFCAVVVASELDYAAMDSDCQIVTGLHRVYAPFVAH